ncbi:hypothetical protein CLOM_g602 [Closterium sp. NIES-68]|nr:hypothetical protein CLOM_g602 [Closterium sp. NIES-68]GJP59780.1 hypothetical protein CLOP_g15144 [Closterium sp. NIES-67]
MRVVSRDALPRNPALPPFSQKPVPNPSVSNPSLQGPLFALACVILVILSLLLLSPPGEYPNGNVYYGSAASGGGPYGSSGVVRSVPSPPDDKEFKEFITEQQMLAHANNVYKMNLRRRLAQLGSLQPPKLDVLQSQLSILVPTFPCPKEERVGVWADGRKWLCNMKAFLPDKPVVYSIGSGGEYSFEKDMFFKFPLTRPLTFDPFLDPSLAASLQALSFLRFLPIGLAGAGVIERAKVDRPGLQFMTVREIMAANNHSYVDVFKVDCDGCEETMVYDIKAGRREGVEGGVGKGVGVWEGGGGSGIGDGSGGGRGGEGGEGGEGRAGREGREGELEEFSRVKPFGDPAIGQILIDLHHVNNPDITLPIIYHLESVGYLLFHVEPSARHPDCCVELSFIHQALLQPWGTSYRDFQRWKKARGK